MRFLLYIAAAACFAYSVIVARVHSGSAFFVIWDILGAVLILIAIGIRAKVWEHLHRITKITVCSVFAAGVILFAVLFGMVLSKYSDREVGEVDYVIVLGAQMKSDGPSIVLKYRLDKAVEYLTAHPGVTAVVSGAQGSNEPCTEARGMADYLIARGIAAERIILEEQSTNTRQNFEYSTKLIPKGVRVGVLTNNFHMKRALMLAGRYGIDEPVAIVAPSTPLYAPNNVLREVLALLKDMILAITE